MIPSNFSSIISFVGAHKVAALILLFISMIIEGESFLIVAGVLVHIGAFPLWQIFMVSLIGVLIGDFFWYFLGVYLRRVKRAEPLIKTFQGVVHRLLPKFRQKPFLSLILAKYVYGTNHATLVLSGVMDMDFWLFTKAEVVATVIWVAVFISIGYLFGGAAILITHRVSVFLLIVLVLIISLMAIQRAIAFYYETKGGVEE